MRSLTISEMKAHRLCQRSHQFGYVMLARLAETADALSFGIYIHAHLEWRWAMGDAAEGRPVAPLADPYREAAADALLLGYQARWGGSDIEGYQRLGSELEFRAPLLNPETGAASRTFELAGKIDAMARDRATGAVYVVEHKTASEDIGIGSDYWRRLRIDSQISTYMVGARALGHDPAGVLYDVLRKPAQRPYKATPVEARKYVKSGDRKGLLYADQHENDETSEEYRERILADIAERPDHYYQRGVVVRLEKEELDAAYDAWATARAIADGERTGRAPRNADACVRWGRTCDYFDVCTGVGSIDDETKYRRASRRHEELSNESISG